MTALGISFEERAGRIGGSGLTDRHQTDSDNGLVPCFHGDGLQVLDSRALSTAEEADINRITAIWNLRRKQSTPKGPFLFGRFRTADAMFAPIVWRFETYNIRLTGTARLSRQVMLKHEAMRKWEQGALAAGMSLDYDRLVESFDGKRL